MVEGYMEMIYSYLGISLNLKLRCFDEQYVFKKKYDENIKEYVCQYLSNKLEIPQLLKRVFNQYLNFFSKFKDKDINDNELKYWKDKYLDYNSIEEFFNKEEAANKK